MKQTVLRMTVLIGLTMMYVMHTPKTAHASCWYFCTTPCEDELQRRLRTYWQPWLIAASYEQYNRCISRCMEVCWFGGYPVIPWYQRL
jgi:hypothetical protein